MMSRYAPVAKRIPHRILLGKCEGEQLRGVDETLLMDPPIEVIDDLYWLRDDERKNEDVLAHLAAENEYARLETGHLAPVTEALYNEFRSRVKESDTVAPYIKGPYSYYYRTEQDKSYKIHCRAPLTEPSLEEIVLDENVLADGHEMCDVNSLAFSRDHSMLAYSVDFSGLEEFTIKFRQLLSQQGSLSCESIVDELSHTNGSIEWSADGRSVFYLLLDDQHRPFQLWLHILGTSQEMDVCLFEEKDERSWLHLSSTCSDDYIILRSTTKLTSEVIAIPQSERALRAAVQTPYVVKAVPLHVKRKLDETEGTKGDNKSDIHECQAGHTTSLNLSFLPYLLTVQSRVEGLLYSVDHYRMQSLQGADGPSDLFVILSNKDGARNFKVSVAPVISPSLSNWKDVLPHSDALYIEDIDIHSTYWAISGRESGYENVWLSLTNQMNFDHLELNLHKVPAPDSVYVLSFGQNQEYDTDIFRFVYNSPTTPPIVCDYRLGCLPPDPIVRPRCDCGVSYATLSPLLGEILVVKQKEVPNINPSDYKTFRLMAPSTDGKLIPISLLYRVDKHCISSKPLSQEPSACPFVEPAPVLLYGYGAYGISWDPSFSPLDLSLCDRGVIFAIAHVRGGGELGRSWYEEGKLMTKKNTFCDFIAAAEHLIRSGWTSNKKIVAQGGSAGGLLMAVVANERPDLFCGILAGVPFVDAVVTMADSSIPLVSTEWDEWGNPNEREAYALIRSYSPMENIRAQEYPPMLLQAGLFDYRVAYWEVAKFAQRLRAANIKNIHGKNNIIFKCEMDEGHTGAMDRFKQLREQAFEYSFVLDCLGICI